MRNKKVFYYVLKSSIDIIISTMLVGFTFIVVKMYLDYLYRQDNNKVIALMWSYWREIKGTLLGDIVSLVVGFGVFFIFYMIVTYRKFSNFINVIEQTEGMASGDLDKVIKTDSNGDLKRLAENINNISSQLKEITIRERQAQQTKNDLITNVSHDLRTPLTSVIGYLEFIDNDKYKDEVELRYYIDIAYKKAKSLSSLISDLFELTKMQNRTVTFKKETINLVDLLGQVVAGFKYQFDKVDMEARVNFSEDRLLINGDGEKLVRVFENIFSNGIKYGKEGYFIDVFTMVDELDAVVRIINYGSEIQAVDLPHIFDRFYRVEKSRNSKIGGSGLGLAIVKNIIELHNGTIVAYSNFDETIFEIRIPLIDIEKE